MGSTPARNLFLCFFQLLTFFTFSYAQNSSCTDFAYIKGSLPEKEFISDFSILQLNFTTAEDFNFLEAIDSTEGLTQLQSELLASEADVICIKDIATQQAADIISHLLNEQFAHIFYSLQDTPAITLIASRLHMAYPQKIKINEDAYATEFAVVRENAESTSIFLLNDSLQDDDSKSQQLKNICLFAENKLASDPQSTFIFCCNTISTFPQKSSNQQNHLNGTIHADLDLIKDFIENERDIQTAFMLTKLLAFEDLDVTQGYDSFSTIQYANEYKYFNQERTLTQIFCTKIPEESIASNTPDSLATLMQYNSKKRVEVEASKDSNGNAQVQGTATYSTTLSNGSTVQASASGSVTQSSNGQTTTSATVKVGVDL